MVTQLRLPSRCASQVCRRSSLNSRSRLDRWSMLSWMILLTRWDLLSYRGILSQVRLLVRLLCAWSMLKRWILLARNMLNCRGLLVHRWLLAHSWLLSCGRNDIWLPSWSARSTRCSDCGSRRCDTGAATADASGSAVIGHKRADVAVGSVNPMDLRSWACGRLLWLCLVSVWLSRLRSGVW